MYCPGQTHSNLHLNRSAMGKTTHWKKKPKTVKQIIISTQLECRTLFPRMDDVCMTLGAKKLLYKAKDNKFFIGNIATCTCDRRSQRRLFWLCKYLEKNIISCWFLFHITKLCRTTRSNDVCCVCTSAPGHIIIARRIDNNKLLIARTTTQRKFQNKRDTTHQNLQINC